jgi:hypothetical protein
MPTTITHRESICDSSRRAKISFCRNAALSSKPSLASAASRLPSGVSASGFTYGQEAGSLITTHARTSMR